MAKIEFTGRSHVVPGRAFHRPGTYEVSDELAKQLTDKEPKLFRMASEGSSDGNQDGQDGEPKLDKMKREDLNALATEKGVENPDQLANRDEVIAAINEADKQAKAS